MRENNLVRKREIKLEANWSHLEVRSAADEFLEPVPSISIRQKFSTNIPKLSIGAKLLANKERVSQINNQNKQTERQICTKISRTPTI